MAKRQTIWLSTMMVLSLMLIGFYTVNNNVEPVTTETSKVAKDNQDQNKETETAVMEQSDFFVAYHMKEDEEMSAKVEQLQSVIANTQSSAEEVEKAKKDLETMNNTADKVEKAIDMITAEGFPDAIVKVQQDGKVNVTVQAKELDKKQAVKIMGIVAKEMQVSSSKVSVGVHE